MKVIDLLETVYIEDIEYIDIFSENEDGLCGVLHPERWREFLTEKVLNSEVFKFSPNDTSSEPGLNIYIKDEETCNDIYKDKFEKNHDDGVDLSIFAKQELDKIIIARKSLVDEINEIVKNDPDIMIQVCYGSYKTCISIYYHGSTEFRNLWNGPSEEDILDVIKDLIRLVKEKEDK